MSDNNKWIQGGAGLADWQNTQTGNAAAMMFSVKIDLDAPKETGLSSVFASLPFIACAFGGLRPR